MVTPIGSNPAFTTTPPTGAPVTSTNPAAIKDTITSVSSSKVLSMVQYLSRVDVPTLSNISQNYQNISNQFINSALFLKTAVANAIAYGKITDVINAYNDVIAQLQTDGSNVSSDLQSVNDSTKISNDNSQITNLNGAITTYQSALSAYQANQNNTTAGNLASAAQAYNSQVAIYNTYLNDPNSGRNLDFNAYNGDVLNYNTDLQAITPSVIAIANEFGVTPPNLQSLPSAGLPAPPTPNTLTQPYTTPPSPLPSTISFTSATIAAPDTSSLQSIDTTNSSNGAVPNNLTLFLPALRLLVNSNASNSALRATTTALYGVQRKFIGVPTATITKVPHIHSLTSPNNPGAVGASSDSFISPFNLSSALFGTSLVHSQNVKNTEGTQNFIVRQNLIGVNIDETRLSNLVPPIVTYSAYAAVPISITRLQAGAATLADNEQFVRGLIALGTAQNLVADIQNGTLQAQVVQLVQSSFKDQNLTADEQNAIVQAAVASFNANVLNSSSILVSGAFQLNTLPQQLFSQVLQDLNVSKEQIALLTSTANPSVATLLANPLTVPLAKQEVLNLAQTLGLPVEQTISLINKAVNATLLTQSGTLDQLKTNSFINFLNQRNVTHTQALLFANQFTQAIANEKTLALNTAIPPNTLSLNTLLQAIQTKFPALANQPAVSAALEATLAAQPATLREFNQNFTQTLFNQHIVDLNTAQNISLAAIASAQQQIVPVPPITPQNVQQNLLLASLVSPVPPPTTPAAAVLTVPPAPVATPPAPTPTVAAPPAPATAPPTAPVTTPPLPVLPTINEQVALNAITAALNATPPPTTVPALQEGLRVALVNQNVSADLARARVENALITTVPFQPQTLAQAQATLQNEFSARIQSITGQRNDQLAAELTNIVLGANNSIRSNLTENLNTLNQFLSQQKQELAPVLTKPIYMQAQDSLYKEKFTFDATTAPMLISKSFIAHPMFGHPHKPVAIDFPLDVQSQQKA